ncbi:TOMM precursor leader peptide-binding protein [Nocardia sp. CDC159]|uniref:TOMM leader peptide-binding protein n=1 Tax=Nocardia pulmonis TaxID=2951408 RepID=A0A9X2ECD9_9NOCA|nr:MULTISPECIES: TOMM precursor leader peptide-binding protein [Nocardia]MCM6775633.1 TOMM precursor leader peptide-binding protein [Nocardia pulmonis]MCM6788391.1 TOMM precursor leader peptide-binding protein [Nocardia sp. CDC159]
MTTYCPRGPMLHPRLAVLRRPSGEVQLGWDPEHAVVLRPPGSGPDAVLGFLRLLDGARSHPQIVWQAGRVGIAATDAVAILAALERAGLLVRPWLRATRVRAVHVHGRGPLSDAIALGARTLGLRPTRSRDHGPATSSVTASADLVILADALVPEPFLVNDLVLQRIPHLQVRIRDGRGIVGPLVLPGGTSCLRCADLIRRDHDADWPHLAGQLLGRVGHASPATVTATTALVLRELELILAGDTARPPRTLDTTLELEPDSHHIDRRHWTPHPACPCRTLRPVDAEAQPPQEYEDPTNDTNAQPHRPDNR